MRRQSSVNQELTLEQVQTYLKDYHRDKGIFRKMAGCFSCLFSSAGRTRSVHKIEQALEQAYLTVPQSKGADNQIIEAIQSAAHANLQRRCGSKSRHAFWSWLIRRRTDNQSQTSLLLHKLANNNRQH